MENRSKIKSSSSQNKVAEKIKALRSQLNSSELEIDGMEDRLVDFDKKKDLGGSLFLAGSALLLLAVLQSPICILLVSICVIVWGLAVYFYGRSDSKETQGRISEIALQIQKIEEELKKLKRNK